MYAKNHLPPVDHFNPSSKLSAHQAKHRTTALSSLTFENNKKPPYILNDNLGIFVLGKHLIDTDM